MTTTSTIAERDEQRIDHGEQIERMLDAYDRPLTTELDRHDLSYDSHQHLRGLMRQAIEQAWDAGHACQQQHAPAATAVSEDPRAEYIAGLRALADLLEQHPELMTPYGQIDVIPYGPEQSREQLAAWARAMPGRKDKQISDTMANLIGSLHGLKIKVLAYRDEVCEKVILGTETVTRKVKDPAALAAVPEIEVEEEIEQYEWVCRPMLADEPAEAASAR